MSKTKYGFTLFDNATEFRSWLAKQVKYSYTGIQVHHTALPDYSCFYKSNGTHEDELTRQNSMKNFHMNTNGWGDIAQHFTVFPNGKICTGRSLHKTTAIGIKGWNTNKICIEIYGNFDKGKDVMKPEQKEAVIMLYGELCKKFGLTPNTNTIRCHAWFTAGGTYLGNYTAGKSAKTCPGTGFMGIGNTQSAFKNSFYPLIEKYMKTGVVDGGGSTPTTQPAGDSKPKEEYKVNVVYRVNTKSLNVRSGAGVSYPVTATIKENEKYTIVEIKYNGTTAWGKLKSGVGWVSMEYMELRDIPTPTPSFKNYIVRVTANGLNGRKEASASSAVVQVINKGVAVTIVEEKMNGTTKWLKTKAGYWISAQYTEFVRYA